MAELVLGAVGVVPLIGFTIKSFQTLCKELNTFGRCSRTVKRMESLLTIQKRIFMNICHLLLRESLEDDTVGAMLKNAEHESWGDEGRSKNLKELLDMNYGACYELIETILETSQKLESGLACFQALKPHKFKVCASLPEEASSANTTQGNIKDTWARLKDGMRLSFNK